MNKYYKIIDQVREKGNSDKIMKEKEVDAIVGVMCLSVEESPHMIALDDGAATLAALYALCVEDGMNTFISLMNKEAREMIETYRTHLIPPAALRTTLYWGGEGEQGEIQIHDLEFKSHKIHNIHSIVFGANISIESCDLDTLWATTEDDAYIRAYRISKIEGLSAEIGPVPIPPLVPPATNLTGCVIVDTIAGRYRYVVDHWYKDIFAATEDSTRNDPPDIVAALHLHWVTQVMDLEAVRGGEPT